MSCPHAVAFSIVSLQGVRLTDAYKMVTSILPVLHITKGMLPFSLVFVLFSPLPTHWNFSSSKVPLYLVAFIAPIFFPLPHQESVDGGAEQSVSALCF